MPRPAIVADPGTKLWQLQLNAALAYLADEFSVTIPDITARFGSKLFRAQLLDVLDTFDTDCPLTERPDITARAFIDAYNGDPTYSLIEGPYA